MIQYGTFLADLNRPSTKGDIERLAGDRRRQGRRDSVSPALISLLRGPLAPNPSPGDKKEFTDDRGDLASVVGIAVAVVLTVPLWAMIGLIGRAVLG